MSATRSFCMLVLVCATLSCGTVTHYGKRPDFTMLSIGDSKSRVIELYGKPEESAAKGGSEYYIYTYAPWYDHNGADGNKEFYYVRFVNGIVESYGRHGDFDSTKPQESTVNININKQASP